MRRRDSCPIRPCFFEPILLQPYLLYIYLHFFHPSSNFLGDIRAISSETFPRESKGFLDPTWNLSGTKSILRIRKDWIPIKKVHAVLSEGEPGLGKRRS